EVGDHRVELGQESWVARELGEAAWIHLPEACHGVVPERGPQARVQLVPAEAPRASVPAPEQVQRESLEVLDALGQERDLAGAIGHVSGSVTRKGRVGSVGRYSFAGHRRRVKPAGAGSPAS